MGEGEKRRRGGGLGLESGGTRLGRGEKAIWNNVTISSNSIYWDFGTVMPLCVAGYGILRIVMHGL